MKIKAWIYDFIKANLGDIKSFKWSECDHECVARIERVCWLPKASKHGTNNTIIISDSKHAITVHLTSKVMKNSKMYWYQKNTLLKIKNAKIKIDLSFTRIYLMIYDCCFYSVIPIYPLPSDNNIDINTNENVQKMVLNCRKNGTILQINHKICIKGQNQSYFAPIHKLHTIYLNDLYLIAKFKSKHNKLQNIDDIPTHFRILAEANITESQQRIRLLKEYGLVPDLTKHNSKWCMRLSIDYNKFSCKSDEFLLKQINYKFDENDLQFVRNQKAINHFMSIEDVEMEDELENVLQEIESEQNDMYTCTCVEDENNNEIRHEVERSWHENNKYYQQCQQENEFYNVNRFYREQSRQYYDSKYFYH